jgi:hypothetical protein
MLHTRHHPAVASVLVDLVPLHPKNERKRLCL